MIQGLIESKRPRDRLPERWIDQVKKRTGETCEYNTKTTEDRQKWSVSACKSWVFISEENYERKRDLMLSWIKTNSIFYMSFIDRRAILLNNEAV